MWIICAAIANFSNCKTFGHWTNETVTNVELNDESNGTLVNQNNNHSSKNKIMDPVMINIIDGCSIFMHHQATYINMLKLTSTFFFGIHWIQLLIG